MKQLTVFGPDDCIIIQCLVDVDGENFGSRFTIPMFLPAIGIVLEDVEDKLEKSLEITMSKVKELLP